MFVCFFLLCFYLQWRHKILRFDDGWRWVNNNNFIISIDVWFDRYVLAWLFIICEQQLSFCNIFNIRIGVSMNIKNVRNVVFMCTLCEFQMKFFSLSIDQTFSRFLKKKMVKILSTNETHKKHAEEYSANSILGQLIDLRHFWLLWFN